MLYLSNPKCVNSLFLTYACRTVPLTILWQASPISALQSVYRNVRWFLGYPQFRKPPSLPLAPRVIDVPDLFWDWSWVNILPKRIPKRIPSPRLKLPGKMPCSIHFWQQKRTNPGLFPRSFSPILVLPSPSTKTDPNVNGLRETPQVFDLELDALEIEMVQKDGR